MENQIEASGLRGMMVVAFEEGVQLGKVFDVYFDRQTKRIVGISYKAKKLGFKKESFFQSTDIQKLGQDVIIVSSEQTAQPVPEAVLGNGVKSMEGLMVVTEGGAHIGYVSDLNLSKDEWKMEGLILDKEKMLEIETSNIVFGEDAIIVPADYMERIKGLDPEKIGILQRLTDTAYFDETVKETAQKFGETVKKATGKVGDTVKETSGKIGDQFKEASGKMGDAVRGKLKSSEPEMDTIDNKAAQHEAEDEKKEGQQKNKG